MSIAAPIKFYGDLWHRALDGLRADALDCLQANLAALADLHHGPGTHLALGSALDFVPAGGPVPVLARSPQRRIEEAGELLGLRVVQRWDDLDGPALRELARHHARLYVVADAYELSWLPYAGRLHMEHSFLLVGSEPSCLVVDAYHNATQWGAARPGLWSLRACDFDRCVPAACAFALDADGPPPLDRGAALRATARELAAALPAIDAYVAAVRGSRADTAAIGRLVLDVWVLGRARVLHAAWLAKTGEPSCTAAAAAARHADSWLALTAQSYVAMRRSQRGASLPDAVVDELARLLHEDVALARRLAAGEQAGTVESAPLQAPEVRAAVVEELRAVLGAGAGALTGRRALRELPGFDSFALVEVIERLEARLGVSVDPAALTAEGLRCVDSLCGLFGGAEPPSGMAS
jgi:acyl carrier protein